MVCHVVQQLVHEPKRHKRRYFWVLTTVCHVCQSPGEKKKNERETCLKASKGAGDMLILTKIYFEGT